MDVRTPLRRVHYLRRQSMASAESDLRHIHVKCALRRALDHLERREWFEVVSACQEAEIVARAEYQGQEQERKRAR